MTSFPGSPRVVRGGILALDPDTLALRRAIAFQYNPDTMTRTLKPQAVGEAGDRSEAVRLLGPPIETVKLELELDAVDSLERAEVGSLQVETSLQSRLAALEALVYPPASQLRAHRLLSLLGQIEIAPAEGPLTVFVWGAQRVLPMRVTDISVEEVAFDTDLNPTRAKVGLGFRVLTPMDLGLNHPGSALFQVFHERRERLAGNAPAPGLLALGIEGMFP